MRYLKFSLISMFILFMAIPVHATTYIKQVYISIPESQKDEANARLEAEGFGPDNISIPIENKDSKEVYYATSAVLEEWQYQRFLTLLAGLDYTIEVIDRTQKEVTKSDYDSFLGKNNLAEKEVVDGEAIANP